MNKPERISNCCGAGLVNDDGKCKTAICSDCKEWAEVETDDGGDFTGDGGPDYDILNCR